MSTSYRMGPLQVAQPHFRADLEVVEFPVRLAGDDIEYVTFWMHVGMPPKILQRVLAVELLASDAAKIELKGDVVLDVTWVEVGEADRRGHRVVVRAPGGAEHDLGVKLGNADWRHVAMIEWALSRYAVWNDVHTRDAFAAEFKTRVEALLVELVELDELSMFAAARVRNGESPVNVHLDADLSRCSVYVGNTHGASRYALDKDDEHIIVRAVTDLLEAEGVRTVSVSADGYRDPYPNAR